MDEKIKELTLEIDSISSSINNKKKINIMEVCGTHTMSIAKNSLQQLLPEKINLVSGPGCPVCVTPTSDIDIIIEIIKKYDITTFTFGDMMRVPGTLSSLMIEKSKGKDIRVCYNPLDALSFAEDNKNKNVLLIAIGFETTTPITAVILKKAFEKNIDNLYIYATHKIIPPAIDALLSDPLIEIDAFMLPGHVSVIIGTEPFKFISTKYKKACSVAGFDPYNILLSIKNILLQIKNDDFFIDIAYKGIVKKEGNIFAVKLINEVFEVCSTQWRGLGILPDSGLCLKEDYRRFDSKTKFPVGKIISKEIKGCECASILKGLKNPLECRMFSSVCTPDNPLGPCMVSSEGSCSAYFRYKRFNDRSAV